MSNRPPVNASDRIAGINAVSQLLEEAPDGVSAVWIASGRADRRMQGVIDLARKASVPVHRVDRVELDEMLGEVRHQGVVAACRPADLLDEAALSRLLEGLDEPPFLLILDSIQDPHNLGACLRSADAAGVHAVILPKDKAVGITPVVRKVASGAVETVPIVQVTNLARCLDALKKANIWIAGAAGEAAQDLYQSDLKGPLAIVMGNEGKGLRRLVREHCDFLIRIPMAGRVESLNVSVATGVCLFEAARQRRG